MYGRGLRPLAIVTLVVLIGGLAMAFFSPQPGESACLHW